ncbi:hypothetical protein ABZ649_04600 [Streptomyces albidoflavus]|uniref:hypothetical protein n=1 Tax=Streptomyces albidoflavus TaxID=1886 RepID=UPI0033D2AE2B
MSAARRPDKPLGEPGRSFLLGILRDAGLQPVWVPRRPPALYVAVTPMTARLAGRLASTSKVVPEEECAAFMARALERNGLSPAVRVAGLGSGFNRLLEFKGLDGVSTLLLGHAVRDVLSREQRGVHDLRVALLRCLAAWQPEPERQPRVTLNRGTATCPELPLLFCYDLLDSLGGDTEALPNRGNFALPSGVLEEPQSLAALADLLSRQLALLIGREVKVTALSPGRHAWEPAVMRLDLAADAATRLAVHLGPTLGWLQKHDEGRHRQNA